MNLKTSLSYPHDVNVVWRWCCVKFGNPGHAGRWSYGGHRVFYFLEEKDLSWFLLNWS